jgi:carbon monoxide dehydrogenase subunit G
VDFSNTVTIRRPRREVFSFISDLENVPRWNYAIDETQKLSSGPVAVGSRYRQVRSLPSRSEEVLEVTKIQPDRAFALRGQLGPFSGTLSYELEEIEGGTRLTNTAHLESAGLMKVAAPLAGPRVREAVAANLQSLKELLEAGG